MKQEDDPRRANTFRGFFCEGEQEEIVSIYLTFGYKR